MDEVAKQKHVAEEREKAQAADPAPVVVRAHLMNGQWMDIGVRIPWVEWVLGLQRFQGIAWSDGFIPLSAIAAIIHQKRGESAVKLGGNVVSFKRPS